MPKLREAISRNLDELSKIPIEELLKQRYISSVKLVFLQGSKLGRISDC